MCETQGSASTEPVIFCCGKTAAASLLIGDAAFSVMAVGSPPAHSHTASQLNIADTIGQGDPVGNRNNRPLLCLALP